MAPPPIPDPSSTLIGALIGAGAWKTVDKIVTTLVAQHRQRKIDNGEPDPKTLPAWLIHEVKLLRTEIATLRVEGKQQLDQADERNQRLAEEHSECRRNLAASCRQSRQAR